MLLSAVQAIRASRFERIFEMMSESLKKKFAYATLGSFGCAVLFPVATDCLRGQLCTIEMPEMWHIDQDTTSAPMFNVVFAANATSTGSAVGAYSSLFEPFGHAQTK